MAILVCDSTGVCLRFVVDWMCYFRFLYKLNFLFSNNGNGAILMRLGEIPLILTFDDIAILPGFSELEPYEIKIESRATRNVELSVPIISSPMDYVTNDTVAKYLARFGSLGIIHRHCSVEEQVKMVREVKKWRGEGFPEVRMSSSIKSVVLSLRQSENGIRAIIDDGSIVGIVKYMGLSSVAGDCFKSIGDAVDYMRKNKTASMLVNAKEGSILIEIYLDGSIRPTKKDEKYVVGAAISPFDKRRVEALDGLADILVMDIAHFHNKSAIEATRRLGDLESDLVIGNIGTFEAAEDIITKIDKIDAFRVGIGSGSICITGEQTGVFAPTLNATMEVYKILREYSLDIPIIADGGVRGVSDALKAYVFGASTVMCGRYIAGCAECPGGVIEIDGRLYKPYRGMGSRSVHLERLMDRYSRVTKLIPEGVEGLVPYQGSILEVIHRFIVGLKVAMGYAGAKNIEDLRDARWGILLQGLGK